MEPADAEFMIFNSIVRPGCWFEPDLNLVTDKFADAPKLFGIESAGFA